MGNHLRRNLFELPWERFIDRLSCYRIFDAQESLKFCCVFIRGKHPVCGEPLFCFSANPDSLSLLCGFHINHRSRSFLLQVSGSSSHLSFCCTSLVSGLIIHAKAPFVYSQTVQRNTQYFVQFLKYTVKMAQKAAQRCLMEEKGKVPRSFGSYVNRFAQIGRKTIKGIMRRRIRC